VLIFRRSSAIAFELEVLHPGIEHPQLFITHI
jgi:hypothetical protein